MRTRTLTLRLGMIAMALPLAACDGTGADGEEIGVPLEVAPADAPESAEAVAPGTEASAGIVLCPPARTDFRGEVNVTSGNVGSWGCMAFCPEGSFAYGFSHKSEDSQGLGDDTALNGIKLNCNSRATGAWTANVTSSTGAWGSWLGVAMCPSTSAPMIAGNVMLEESQGVFDDTAANRMNGTCRNGTSLAPPAATAWGSFRGFTPCPNGQAVCGIQTRVEGSQGVDDDTALNGVRLACCTFTP